MKRAIVYIFCCLLALPVLRLSAQAERSPDTMTLFGNPAERMQSIRNLLRETGEKIMEQKRMLDDVLTRIVANERRITANLSAEEREKIRRENIANFKEIEAIRERVAQIQYESGQAVYRIEQAFYQSLVADIALRKSQLNQSAVEYWLRARKLLFTPSEQNSMLPDNEVRNLYK
ncbi:MAG: hypothetical protein LBC99_04105 [Spirochaetota bacterium]|nr:hypothetical protein [Spirochaetota bacterium]